MEGCATATKGDSMRATVNGKLREIAEGATIGALLADLGAARGGVAVARNDRVVRRSEYDSDSIADGDRIEIIQAVAGG
jgi:sulfur carrier protein